jgi:hypothetical protein
MNTFMNGLKEANNFTYTENGAVTHKSTMNAVLDLFALGGAYRTRSEEDCITLFEKAYEADPVYALKCLFYLADCRGGQGERRFFRVCYKWLANNHTKAARRNMQFIPEYRRWDDLYCLIDTPLEKEMFAFLRKQLELDVTCKTPSLLAKWLKSENTSSPTSQALGAKTRKAFGLTSREYRKILSALREKINVLERLMSANKWDEIEFDKIPSKAGLIYKNAFARHDFERAKNPEVQSYADFAKDTTKKVNAAVLNPVDIAEKVFGYGYYKQPTDTDRLMLDKYWANLKDYYNGREENGIAIVDVSGSMSGQPMNAAVSMGAYIAERGKGPFKNHFITFSNNPELVEFVGADIYDKFQRARGADWGGSTNIEATFEMLLNVACKENVKAADMPKTLYIFSDMEFNACMCSGPRSMNRWGYSVNNLASEAQVNTLLEAIANRWAKFGYELPRVIFWNLNARNDNIPALNGRFGYVSGFSMSMVETILSGKDGWSLAKEKLDTERYAPIH